MEDENPETQKVLAAIYACQASLTTQIEEVKVDISLIRQDAQRTRECLTEVKQRVSTLEDQGLPLFSMVREMESTISSLRQHLDDQENRLRRCNLHFVGMPERVECPNPQTFLESFLTSTYGRKRFVAMFAVKMPTAYHPRHLPGSPAANFPLKIFKLPRQRYAAALHKRARSNSM